MHGQINGEPLVIFFQPYNLWQWVTPSYYCPLAKKCEVYETTKYEVQATRFRNKITARLHHPKLHDNLYSKVHISLLIPRLY